ncbi:hypothetical protein NGUA15_03727 [Salmonella enterica]|nr:hypothetical protein NGUA15_03727 [Salmonella enterica]
MALRLSGLQNRISATRYLRLCLFFRCRLRQKAFQYYQRSTDTDRAIGKVERREMPVADVKIDHIDNEAVPQTIEQIPQRAADD